MTVFEQLSKFWSFFDLRRRKEAGFLRSCRYVSKVGVLCPSRLIPDLNLKRNAKTASDLT